MSKYLELVKVKEILSAYWKEHALSCASSLDIQDWALGFGALLAHAAADHAIEDLASGLTDPCVGCDDEECRGQQRHWARPESKDDACGPSAVYLGTIFGIAKGRQESAALIQEAKLQIEYLHEKFGETGSGNAVLMRLKAWLEGK